MQLLAGVIYDQMSPICSARAGIGRWTNAREDLGRWYVDTSHSGSRRPRVQVRLRHRRRDRKPFPRGLNEDVVRLISAKKDEPEWLLEWRLKAYRHWLTMKEPTWANVHYAPIDYQDIIYYSAPKQEAGLKSLDEVDPELPAHLRQARHPARRAEAPVRRRGRRGLRQRVGGDHVQGRSSPSSASSSARSPRRCRSIPELVRKYLGSVVPVHRQLLRDAQLRGLQRRLVRYIPKGVRCPMELSTYFRINAKDTGQFERTLIIADEGAYVSYLEGCTAPMRDENQLHAAVVELVALDDATIKYSTIQNWYPGRQGRQGRHLQLRDQARQVRRRQLEDHLDAGRNRLGDHVEVSRAASCRATTRSASSTRWRRRTTGSRPTPARR